MSSDLSAIRERGFRVLVKELGAADTVRFMRQFENGQGNYTEEREETLKGISLEDIITSIKQRKARFSIQE